MVSFRGSTKIAKTVSIRIMVIFGRGDKSLEGEKKRASGVLVTFYFLIWVLNTNVLAL